MTVLGNTFLHCCMFHCNLVYLSHMGIGIENRFLQRTSSQYFNSFEILICLPVDPPYWYYLRFHYNHLISVRGGKQRSHLQGGYGQYFYFYCTKGFERDDKVETASGTETTAYAANTTLTLCKLRQHANAKLAKNKE